MPKQWMIAAAGGLAAALVLVTGVLLMPKATDDGPADLLPAETTAVLLLRADGDALARLREHIEGLDAVPMPGHPVDIALLAMPDGRTAWVVFDPAAAPAGARYGVTASDESVRPLIGKGEGRLAQDDSYQGMRAFLRSDMPAAYLAFPRASLTGAASALFSPREPLAVILERETTRLILPGEDTAALSIVLSDTTRTLLQSRVRTIASELFGPTVSPAYDLLSLVREGASLELRNGTDITAWGQAGSASEARAGVDRLHDAFAAAQPGVEIVNRQLDDQFSYTGVRKAESGVETSSGQRGGFTVRTTSGNDAVFLTAVRGPVVVLANSENMLSAGMDAAASGGNRLLSLDAASVGMLAPSLAEPTGIRWAFGKDAGHTILEIGR